MFKKVKAKLTGSLWLGVVIAGIILSNALSSKTVLQEDQQEILTGKETLKTQALKILDMKCNVCHKKQNPFMVFKEKNMSKRAKKIYQMVFVERRMPKGNEIQLTDDEYDKLKEWLSTEEIN